MASQGDPQDQLRAIHVAGTNGKGSTVSYLASVLREAGYTVGTFTSPHLVAHQDRIRIQERWIDDATFVRYVYTYRDLLEQWDLAMFDIDFFFEMCIRDRGYLALRPEPPSPTRSDNAQDPNQAVCPSQYPV